MDYPWPEGQRWLRAVMLMDLHGAVSGPDGKSGSISGPADRRVFQRLRGGSDAVLVGAETFRIERYQPLVPRPEWRESRRAAGQTEAPQLVIVTRTLALPWYEPVFSESHLTPIVATVSGHDPSVLTAARRHATVLECDEQHVNPRWLIASLEALRLRRLICEGGPRLLNSMVAAGLVDEWSLTLAPSAQGHPYSLVGSEQDEGFHFMRYVRLPQ